MSSTLLSALFGLLAAIGVGVINYIATRRQRSGKIATSEAETLWAESQDMRTELRNQVRDLRAELEKRDSTIAAMRTELDELRDEIKQRESPHA